MLNLLLGLAGWLAYTLNQQGIVAGNWAALRPVSIHFITIGWLTQLIFAVIYWMFPIISREHPYGDRWIGWAGFWGLNVGLWARAVFELGVSHGLDADAGWGLVGAALLQWGGATAWILASWPRIRAKGKR